MIVSSNITQSCRKHDNCTEDIVFDIFDLQGFPLPLARGHSFLSNDYVSIVHCFPNFVCVIGVALCAPLIDGGTEGVWLS